MTADRSIAVIVPVHNAWHHAHVCLKSIGENATGEWRLILVNDASDAHTTRMIRGFAADMDPDRVTLIEHAANRGYLQSINEGIEASRADLLVLLNSDAVLPSGAMDRLRDVFDRDEQIGIVNAVSTWANWTRIPFPPGTNRVTLEKFVREHGEDEPAPIGNASGFFFAVRRSLFDKLGRFDEAYDPGYWEEADFCMRAGKAGFKVMVDRKLFVYHHGWGTFRQAGRDEHLARNRTTFMERWQDEFEALEAHWRRANPVSSLCDAVASSAATQTQAPRVRFLVDTLEPSLWCIDAVNALINSGVDCNVVCMQAPDDSFYEFMPACFRPLVIEEALLFEAFPDCEIVIAHQSRLVELALALQARRASLRVVHMVETFPRDFDAQFDAGARTLRALCEKTENKLAPSDWLVDLLGAFPGQVRLVPPAVNLDVFYPRNVQRRDRLLIKTNGQERHAELISAARRHLARRCPHVEIIALGAHDADIEPATAGELAHTLSECTALWDLDGRDPKLPLQAMACGAIPIMDIATADTAYAKHRFNCLLYQAGDRSGLLASLEALFDDKVEFSRSLAEQAAGTANAHGLDRQAETLMNAFAELLR